ncbi:MAG: hypothetical protein L0216_05995 [Planctomycetales bacterium]|nr:hypothetical protein [Planctomycetales bacterium]
MSSSGDRRREAALAAEIRGTYGPALAASGDRAGLAAALEDLEYLNCERDLAAETKLFVVDAVTRDFHLRGIPERRAIARFLDAFCETEVSVPLTRRIAAIRMEEVDLETRESLLPPLHALRATDELLAELADPPREMLKDGYALLVLVDALETRVRRRLLGGPELDRLIEALRRARALRASHIAKPFLWKVETLLEAACARRGVPVPGGCVS